MPTRPTKIASLQIGGGAPITVQAMTDTDTRNVASTVAQIHDLEAAGCDIIRVAVPDMEAAQALGSIKSQIAIPLVADIHFDYLLALEAIRQGVDKIRINPGNLSRQEHVRDLAAAAADNGIPIRVGVNAGSVPEAIRARHQGEGDVEEHLAAAMVETAIGHVELLEHLSFRDIVVSLKAFDLRTTWLANRRFSEQRDYPLHLGITEAGLPPSGIARSAIGIGLLLKDGLGDTIRVSLTGDAALQVRVGREILASLEIDKAGVILVTCPTCGRCRLDLSGLARAAEERLRPIDRQLRREGKSLRVAVMGCAVNGPGEARDADVGIAGGSGKGVIFVQGKPAAAVAEANLLDALIHAVEEHVRGDPE